MNSDEQDQPRFITLDLEQWRQDIHTFASTTRHALDAIANELSNKCSVRPGQTPSHHEPVSWSPRSAGDSSTGLSGAGAPDERLAKLKNQLAERLARK